MDANTLSDRFDPVPNTGGMIALSGKPFAMGSDRAGEFERPSHSVEVSDFFLDAHLVTNREFAEFVDSTHYVTGVEKSGTAWGYDGQKYREIEGLSWKSYALDRGTHPVVLVSWFDASAFAVWAGKRLPTEAEWEFAARCGATDSLYPWGDAEPDADHCGYGKQPSEMPGTSPVGAYPPNALGIYDIVGNVWQWCGDWFGASYYSECPQLDPQGPPSGTLKIRRGGAWNVIQPFRLRNSNRGALRPGTAAPNIGFRCALSK